MRSFQKFFISKGVKLPMVRRPHKWPSKKACHVLLFTTLVFNLIEVESEAMCSRNKDIRNSSLILYACKYLCMKTKYVTFIQYLLDCKIVYNLFYFPEQKSSQSILTYVKYFKFLTSF